jgi:hypothetical protein
VAHGLGEIELSDADVSVIALALQLSRQGWGTCILTSDYSIQNLASRLGLMVKPILYQGIRRVISWEVYYGACGWSGDGKPGDPCPRCGHTLKKKALEGEEMRIRVFSEYVDEGALEKMAEALKDVYGGEVEVQIVESLVGDESLDYERGQYDSCRS